MRGLQDKVAIVTGAARRRSIGRAVARRLAEEGCDVVVADIAGPQPGFPGHETATAGELDESAGIVRDLGRRALPVRCDVTVEADVRAMVDAAVAEFGRVDILANVAGGDSGGMAVRPFHTVEEAAWDQVLGVNLKGVWLCSKHVAAHMLARGGGGAIVSIASQAGKTGFPMLGAYCAAKHGVLGLTRSMAHELGAAGIRVNAVCPGTVDTDLLNKDGRFVSMLAETSPGLSAEQALQRWLAQNVPLRRLEQPEDVASYVAFLCSDDAGYITGQAVNTSGGQEMH